MGIAYVYFMNAKYVNYYYVTLFRADVTALIHNCLLIGVMTLNNLHFELSVKNPN